MKVTLDTNVFVSALEFCGTLARILDLQTDEVYTLCVSESLLEELRRVLQDGFDWSVEDIETVLDPIVARAILVEPRTAVRTSRDANDDHILACAMAAAADVLVTGDKDLLVPGEFEGIPIVTPREFLAALGAS